VSLKSDDQKLAFKTFNFRLKRVTRFTTKPPWKKYYHDLVPWDDLPRIVKDKPFEADFTIAMYDEPDGAEIPGSGYRDRILPDIY
jgi:hypothetical protein